MVEDQSLVSLGGKRTLSWQRSTMFEPTIAHVTMPAQSQGAEGFKEGLDAKPDY